MQDYFKKVLEQISDFFSGLSPGKKLAAVVTLTGILAFIISIFFWAARETYIPLMTNLNQEDSTRIIRVLREKKIPFKIDPSGKNIEIPPERIHDLRLELAAMGLPEHSVIGYEVFDKQALGTTSFVQEINSIRAKEGELTRTIMAIKGVKTARIHLAIPRKSAFVEDQKEPTASVALDLEPGVRMNEKQIYGIGTLVASAIEGLSRENVTIIDSSGRTLTENTRDSIVLESVNQLNFQRKLEQDLEKRVEQILERIVGGGQVVARVSAELDFSVVSETQRSYDPDGAAVISAQKNEDVMQGARPAPGGVAGAQANLPELQPQAQDNAIRTNTNKLREVTNYKVPETLRQTRRPSGTIKKMTVAVVVDGKTVTAADENGVIKTTVEPWPPEKLEEFKTIVANTLGVDLKRGDVLEIKNISFKKEDLSEIEKRLEKELFWKNISKLGLYLLICIIIAMFFLWVVRPFIKWITENTIDSVDSFLPQTIEELEKIQRNANIAAIEEAVPIIPERVDPEKVEGEMMKEKIVSMVDSNPQKSALVLREWVRAPAPKKESDATTP